MTRTLDEDLAAAAPDVRERTPALRAALHELIEDTEREVYGAARRKRRIMTVAFAATALLGTGTTAAAAGWVPTPWWEGPQATTQPATSTSGADCTITYAPRALVVPAHPVSDVDRAAAMSAAAEFLRTFDYSSIADAGGAAQFKALNDQLAEALRQQGLSTYAVSVAMASDCPDGADR